MSSDGRGERRARQGAARLTAAALVAVAGLGGPACTSSADGDAGGDRAGERDEATLDGAGEGRTEATEPPGGDTEAVTGYVEGLLRHYDAAVAAIIVDPGIVRDRSSPAVTEYLDLFEPGSAEADQALAGWADAAEAGTTVGPLTAGTPMIASRLDGAIEPAGDDEVGFATCAEHHYRVYDGQGAVQDVVDMVGRSGQGTAVRVDGRWRLRRLELRDDRPACATTGATGATGSTNTTDATDSAGGDGT